MQLFRLLFIILTLTPIASLACQPTPLHQIVTTFQNAETVFSGRITKVEIEPESDGTLSASTPFLFRVNVDLSEVWSGDGATDFLYLHALANYCAPPAVAGVKYLFVLSRADNTPTLPKSKTAGELIFIPRYEFLIGPDEIKGAGEDLVRDLRDDTSSA